MTNSLHDSWCELELGVEESISSQRPSLDRSTDTTKLKRKVQRARSAEGLTEINVSGKTAKRRNRRKTPASEVSTPASIE